MTIPLNTEDFTMLELVSFGAASEVGRSCFLLSDGERYVVLDSGIKIQPKRLGLRSQAPTGIDEFIPQLDAVLLSHAHMDHSGYIPALFKSENQPDLHMTEPTTDLLQILWKDHLKIEGSFHYSHSEIEKANRNTIGHEYNSPFRVTEGVTAQFLDAGHVLGSAAILLDWEGQLILYTGDINNQKTPFHDPADLSGLEGDQVAVLITETTNGRRPIPTRKQAYSDFTKAILKTYSRGGKIIAPSFALGRSQELEAFLAMQFDDFLYRKLPVYVDGMILRMNAVHEKFFHRKWVSPRILSWAREFAFRSPFDHHGLHPVETTRRGERRENIRNRLAKNKRRMVIISTSGMMEGGPIHSYLRIAGGVQKNLLAVVGYQAMDTIGYAILNGERKHVVTTPWGETFELDLQLDINRFNFSGHMSSSGLEEYAILASPHRIVAVHGENPSEFVGHMQELGFAGSTLTEGEASLI
jgi:predicted metal-dependent RNase